jgi:hypothetical protein
MVSFYLATGFGMIRSSYDVPDPYQTEVIVELPGNIARAIADTLTTLAPPSQVSTSMTGHYLE